MYALFELTLFGVTATLDFGTIREEPMSAIFEQVTGLKILNTEWTRVIYLG
jgi:hypothetical protein